MNFSQSNTRATSGANPRVSVVMSVYNGEPYLREAVESILNQTYQDFELIIIDDASTDNSREVLSNYDDHRIMRLYNPVNLGLTPSLNRGLAVSRGEFIARQDADDLSLPTRLAQQLDYLDRHPDIGVLGTQMEVINAAGTFVYNYELPVSHSLIAWSLFFGRSVAHPTVMLRRQVLEDAGGYDPVFTHVEDFELWTRLLEKTKFANLGYPLYRYRDRADSISHTKAAEQLVKVIRARHLLANRLLGREVPPELLEWLHQSQLPKNPLTEAQMKEVISLILDLHRAMSEKGLFREDESSEVQADLVARIMAAGGGAKGEGGRRLARPIKLLFSALAQPGQTVRALKQWARDLRGRFPPVSEGNSSSAAPGANRAAPAPHPGITVVVLSYERTAGLAALLKSLLAQDLGGLKLELLICNNSSRVHLKPSPFSQVGRLLSQFADVKIFNSSYNWRCRVRYGVAALAAYDTIMFIDDDLTLAQPNFITYMWENFRTLNPVDLLSCWNTLWVEWGEDELAWVSLCFLYPEITRLTETDTIGPGICMFHKQLLTTPGIMSLDPEFPAADDMAFPLLAALQWGSRSYYLPSYGMLKWHQDHASSPLHSISGHYDDLYYQFKSLLTKGYQPVLSREPHPGREGDSPEQQAARVLPREKYPWK